MAKPTDATLIVRIIAGETAQFGELMQRYEDKLLRYVTYLIHDATLAQDIVQETFIKTYRNLRGYNPKYKFSSWIYRIAHNEAMSALRSRRHIDTATEVESLEAPSEIDIVHDIDHVILRGHMQACLNGLDAKYREVLMLQYYEHMRYDEIADVLHTPPSTVGVWASRGKAKLRKLCEEKGVKP